MYNPKASTRTKTGRGTSAKACVLGEMSTLTFVHLFVIAIFFQSTSLLFRGITEQEGVTLRKFYLYWNLHEAC